MATAKTPAEKAFDKADIPAFVAWVRENDMLLKGRDREEYPHAKGWHYLIAEDLLNVETKAVTAAMVAHVKQVDREVRGAKPKAAKAPAKRRTTKAAPKAVAKAAAAPATDEIASVKADIAALTDAIGSILTMLGEK